jgi:hypothetical protein
MSVSQIKQFTIGCSKTINLGNFQSLRIEASVVVEVETNRVTGDPVIDPRINAKAQEQLKLLLEETYKAQRKVVE